MLSEMRRAAMNAERPIGMARKRSIMPLLMSSARPTAVEIEIKVADWTIIPGIRKST